MQQELAKSGAVGRRATVIAGMPGMEAEFAATMAKRQATMNEKNNKVFLEICYFEFSVIVAIFINSLFLAAYDPLEEEGGPNNVMCDSAGKCFTIVFTLEMCVKMIDQGVVFGSVRPEQTMHD